MNWNGWSEFWSMGGDGLYIWNAYLVTVVVILTEIGVIALTRRSILEHLGRYAKIALKERKPRNEDSRF